MQIETISDLKKIIKEDKNNYFKESFCRNILNKMKYYPNKNIFKYIKYSRIANFYYGKRNKNILFLVLYILSYRRMSRMGERIGIECGECVFGKRIKIYHSFGTVINGQARIGNDCKLYGNNCIGNNGRNNKCPNIGNGVRLCVGSKVLGDVTIANNVTVAAGAIVIKDCLEENAILAGVPAKIIGYNNELFMD